MASADYSVGTKVTADVSNFEKGMNNAEKSLKGFSDKLANSIDRLGKKGLIGSVANVTLAMQGLTKSFNTVIKFAKDVGKAINECTEAYKGQVIAERALDTAIQNNPFVTSESSKALKEFASDMQRVSNYGDEELIPMMTNLVSLGRTESEVMQIMSVAMDMSAGMGISLDTAITQLNATLNGNIGRLGQQDAELKDLTEEELRSGKAIEILGEKFKGLSGATADTSKQLQNIKGDFKEALGQFTLPSSDMWNKFWAGFYERGIEVLRKLDDYLDINTVGKKIFENIQDEAKKIAKSKKLKIGDVLGDFNFISEQLSGLSEKELSVLKKSLEGIKDRTDIEQYWLNMVSKRLHNIELEADQERANAKAEAERAKAEEERLAKEKELADLRKKQEEEREKALAVQDDWENKLFNIRIENLEKIRDKELDNEKLTQEQKIEINEFYGDQILAMKIKQIEKERDAILSDDKLTEESRVAIGLYYENKITQVKGEEEEKRLKLKKKEIKEEEKEEKKKFDVIIGYLQQFAKKTGTITKKIGDVIKKVADVFKKTIETMLKFLKTSLTLFRNLIQLNFSDTLDILLKFEDAVLTFFVETLPKLPQFVSTVLRSINTMLSTLINSVKAENVATVIYGILDELASNLPNIVQNILTIIQNMISFSNEHLADIVYKFLKILEENAIPVIEGLLDLLTNVIKDSIDGLFRWLDEGGLQSLLNLALKIQTSVQDIFMKLLTSVADLLENHTGDVTQFISESLQKAMEDLPKLVDALLRIVNSLIKSVADLFKDKKFVDTMVQSMIDTFDSLMDRLPNIIGAVVDLILSLITALVPRLPEIIIAVVTKIGETIPKVINEIVDVLGKAIGDIFSKIFTKEFWLDIFSQIGNALGEIFSSIGNSLAEAVQGFGNVYNENPTVQVVVDTGAGIATGGLYNLGKWIGQQFGWWATGTNNAPSGLAVVGEAGPELVKFRGGEQVLNNRNTNKALENMGGTTINQNVTFNNLQDTTAYAMMNQLKQYNRSLAINGVI